MAIGSSPSCVCMRYPRPQLCAVQGPVVVVEFERVVTSLHQTQQLLPDGLCTNRQVLVHSSPNRKSAAACIPLQCAWPTMSACPGGWHRNHLHTNPAAC